MNTSTKLLTMTSALLTASLFGRAAPAGLVLNFSSDGGSSFSSDFNATTGDSLQIGVYLTDTDAGGVLATDGLFGFGLSGSTSPTNLGMITATAINPVFDFGTTDEFTASTVQWEDIVLLNDIPTGQSISLGTFTYESSSSGTTLFTFGHNAPGATKWLAGDGITVLDEAIFGPGAVETYQVTVTTLAVPEPSSFCVLLGGIACTGMFYRRRHVARLGNAT